MLKDVQISDTKDDKNISNNEINTSSYSDRSRIPSWDHIKKFNVVKKENSDLKEAIKQLNKSLDIVIKSQSSQNKKKSNPIPILEDLSKKPESKQFLVSKIHRDFSSYRERSSPTSESDKNSASSDISSLQVKLKRLQAENLALKKGSDGVSTSCLLYKNEGRSLVKELDLLKEKLQRLVVAINEDERLIRVQEAKIRDSGRQRSVKSSPKPVGKGEEQISELEKQISLVQEKIGELEATKKTEEEVCSGKLRELKDGIETKKADIAQLEAILKDKDRSCRLKKMQIKAQQRENRQARPITPEIYILNTIKE